MDFKNEVKNIQAAGYHGASTVSESALQNWKLNNRTDITIHSGWLL